MNFRNEHEILEISSFCEGLAFFKITIPVLKDNRKRIRN